MELLVLLAFLDATELELLLLLAAAGAAFAFASSSLLARSLLDASTAAGSRARRTAKTRIECSAQPQRTCILRAQHAVCPLSCVFFHLIFDEMSAELCDGLTEGQHANAHLGLHQLFLHNSQTQEAERRTEMSGMNCWSGRCRCTHTCTVVSVRSPCSAPSVRAARR